MSTRCRTGTSFLNNLTGVCEPCMSDCVLLNRQHKAPCGAFTNTQCGDCLAGYTDATDKGFKDCKRIIASLYKSPSTTVRTSTLFLDLSSDRDNVTIGGQILKTLGIPGLVLLLITVLVVLGVIVFLIYIIIKRQHRSNTSSDFDDPKKVTSNVQKPGKNKGKLLNSDQCNATVCSQASSGENIREKRKCVWEKPQKSDCVSESKPFLESNADNTNTKCFPQPPVRPRPSDIEAGLVPPPNEQSINLEAIGSRVAGSAGNACPPNSEASKAHRVHHTNVQQNPAMKVHIATSTNSLDKEPKQEGKYDQAPPVNIININNCISKNNNITMNSRETKSRHQSDENIGYSKEEEGHLTTPQAEVGSGLVELTHTL